MIKHLASILDFKHWTLFSSFDCSNFDDSKFDDFDIRSARFHVSMLFAKIIKNSAKKDVRTDEMWICANLDMFKFGFSTLDLFKFWCFPIFDLSHLVCLNCWFVIHNFAIRSCSHFWFFWYRRASLFLWMVMYQYHWDKEFFYCSNKTFIFSLECM